MDSLECDLQNLNQEIIVDDVKRLLEVGQLLFSVLNEDEIKSIQKILEDCEKGKIGNTGVS